MLWWLLLVPLVLLAVHLLLWVWSLRARRMLAGLPSYSELPLIGNIHQILGDGEDLMVVLEKMSRIIDETGLPFKFWIGPFPCLVVSDPEDVKAVTNAFVAKPYFYSLSKDFVGEGLISAPESLWKQNIKKLGNAFNVTVVDGYQDIFNSLSAKLVRKLKMEVGRKPVHILEVHLAMTTLQTIAQTALGIPDHMLDDVINPHYLHTNDLSQKLFIERLKNFIYHSDIIYHLTPAYKESIRCRDILHGMCQEMVINRRKDRNKMKEEGLVDPEMKQKNRLKPFIDIILDMQESDHSITDRYLRHEVMTAIVGGYETISLSMLYTLIVLGNRPDIQEKVYDEVKSIFCDSKRPVEKADMAQMQYCEAVIKESLRLYPPAPLVMREADRDLKIKSCTIPKGTACGVNIWGANRLKSCYGDDADEFRPERWLEGNLSEFAPTFLPFSFGRRACIGRKYAMPFQKTMLAYCIREFKFKTFDFDKLVLCADITVKPSRRLCTTSIEIHPRKE